MHGDPLKLLLKEERHRRILELLRSQGKVLAGDLVTTLAVSADTIRRDLRQLDDSGDLMRVHGGALNRLPNTPSYLERVEQRVEANAAIGIVGASLIQSGQTIFMDGGATTLQVARAIPSELLVTVVTNSPALAIEMASHKAANVILVGGTLLKESQVATGAEAVEQVSRFRADLLFLGACALHRKQGITVPSLEEAPLKRAMLQCAKAAIGMATAERLNAVAPYVVGPVEKLRYLIVDSSADLDLLRKYRKLGIEVLSV